MMKQMVVFGFASLMAVTCFAGWEVEKPDEKTVVLRNDSPEALAQKQVQVLPLINNGVWVKKSFDLNQLPAGWKTQYHSAALRIYMQVADQSEAVKKIARNGLTEQFEILVNGHSMIVDTADPRLSTQVRRWIDLSIPMEWLNEGANEVKMHKIDSPTNDDFIYLGVDVSATPECSKVSVDSGRNYRFESKFLSGLKGEYMIRLVLSKESK